MRYIKHIFFIIVFIGIVHACVEPYEVRSIAYEKALVVEGRFTDQQQRHYVKLSYTRSIDDMENRPVLGATVWVEGSDGSKIEFAETSPGYYESEEEVAGVAGNSYQLFFDTAEGKRYQSKAQALIASPPIDRIYNAYAEKTHPKTGGVVKGIQFFVDTHDDTNEAKYYKYEWEETYEVYAPYPSFYEYSHNPDTAIARTEEVSPCYVSAKSNSITIGTTATLTENRLTEVPVRYITSDTEHLLNAYSILVKQYVISPEAYGFYRDILQNDNDRGSLFDQQLGAVIGNITSSENPEETVLGFFEVSGMSEQRAFVRYKDLDKRFPWPKTEYPCNGPDQVVQIYTLDSLDYYVRSKGYGIVSAEYCYSSYCVNEFSATLAPRYCTDCRFRGPAVKPDFWIY